MATLKEDLARPEAYAEPRPTRVDVLETHISWVFLTEADVFKVKKPVRLPFLDFSTIQERRRACEAELVLNARLANDVYRRLVPVRRSAAGTHALGGGEAGEDGGAIVDWAVHMRRLPDERRADNLLARGALVPDDVDRIAERLAAFHAGCRSDAATASFGTRDAIASSIEENFAQTRASMARYVTAQEAAEIARWQRAVLEQRADVFAARAAAGRVRDGHGDLRLEHIYLGDERGGEGDGGDITIIDCIEFNDRFRYGDVGSDVAFLSMDLAWHGAVNFAERLLARYARASNDFDLYELVDFYESYRAFVRGKVAHLLAADEGVPVELRARAAHEARRYFLLALSSDRRSLLTPAVVAVGGVIASGKSTIAEQIAGELSAPIVDADRTRKHMIGALPTVKVHEQPWSGAYDLDVTARVYDEVLRRADVVLRSGRPVVIDASFRSARLRAAARRLAVSRGVPFRFVECRVPREVARARLVERARGASVSDGRLEIFDDFCARWEPVTDIAEREHVLLDTSRPLEESLARARARVATWPPGLVG
jgi:uncharacterized protein